MQPQRPLFAPGRFRNASRDPQPHTSMLKTTLKFILILNFIATEAFKCVFVMRIAISLAKYAVDHREHEWLAEFMVHKIF